MAEELREHKRAGLNTVWVAKAYGVVAPSLIGFPAAETEKVQIASGILPIYARMPTLLAMTAVGVDALSNRRAMLGLGASGPQVIEGWHWGFFTTLRSLACARSSPSAGASGSVSA